jgi:hypothetical protein
MLNIKGNREFVKWWDLWMSRIHPNRDSISENQPATNTRTNQKGVDSQSRARERRVRLTPKVKGHGL